LSIGDLYEHAPGGASSSIAPLVVIVGIGANGDYVNENQNTVLRFMSVVWRTIDALEKDPSLYDLQAPYLNSVAGTDLTGEGLRATVESLHPLAPFEDGNTYFKNPDSVLYYKNAWGAIIKEYADNGILPSHDITPDDIVWAAGIWNQMEDYRVKSDELMKELEAKALSDEKKTQLEQARTFY